MDKTREVLKQLLDIEAENPPIVHPFWERRRLEMREFIMSGDLSKFPEHPVCRDTFYRMGWAAPQEQEMRELQASPLGRELLQKFPSPDTNMLGQMHYMLKVPQASRVMEIGGGYGAFANIYTTQYPDTTYGSMDLAEMLALQYYYLTSLGKSVWIGNHMIAPGQITLIPASFVDTPYETDLLFSAFAISESPKEFYETVERQKYWGASTVYIAGCAAGDFGSVEIITGVKAQYQNVEIKAFHIGASNYELLAKDNTWKVF